MADALVSPAVAGCAGLLAIATLAVAASKIKKKNDSRVIPLMGVMGAFVFAAQMINFSIPGTGSSGHIIGGILLAAMLGPWAGFITLCSVLVVQCLVFADGGLMALGCNILNMAVCTCLIAYPLVYKPIMSDKASVWRTMAASILACVFGLELGAVFVTAETELSGVTALPFGRFLGLMTSIHLLIGLCEGVATGMIICYIRKYSPSLLATYGSGGELAKVSKNGRVVLAVLAVAALVLGVAYAWIASANPDGLEWSIEKITGSTELAYSSSAAAHSAFKAMQTSTSIMPDYESHWSGIVGCLAVVAIVWAVSLLCVRRKQPAAK